VGGGTLRATQVRASEGGVLELRLTPAPASIDIGAEQPIGTWLYDGMLPGPTWEIRPGDVLRITVANELPALPSDDHAADHVDAPHEWSTTNLHTHGLHVSPEGRGDDVFVTIEPGATHDYEIEVPADHPGGLFWYHPHRHGGVAQQVRGGMAGAIIVRGELDAVPEVAAAVEQLMVLQAIEVGDDYVVPAPIPDPSSTQWYFPSTQTLFPVNGGLSPTIEMRPGEVQRWRILNAAEGKFMNLVLDGLDVFVLAWDGLTLAAPEPAPNLLLSPGNRVDVLVRAAAAGTYEVAMTPTGSVQADAEGVPAPTTSSLPPGQQTLSIATVVVDGEAMEMALPSSLPVWDPPILPIAARRTITYTVDYGGPELATFGIDGNAYRPDAAPYQVQLDTAEEWTVVNGVDANLPDHAHVFHIHVNPFKVTEVNGEVLDTPLWRDTFVLTGSTGDSFTFQSNFVDFTGRFPQHCHIVSHEDLGMMEIIEVVDGEAATTEP
jgi:FtsP/CotA-like multicopper oxidase with cupredoxin domain